MALFEKKWLAIAVAAGSLALTACDDGKNGKQGPAGADGAPGVAGKGEVGAQGPAGAKGEAGTNGADGMNGQDLTAAPKLTRIATVTYGGEVTGLFKTDNGELFFNVQHALTALENGEKTSQVGVIEGLDLDNLDPHLEELSMPTTDEEKMAVRLAAGTYKVLGTETETFSGALPAGMGAILDNSLDGSDANALIKVSPNPDFNAFVSTTADGSAGYLFTAWEDRPGSMSRIKVERNDDGQWSANSSDVSYVDFSSVHGTMINCFGTLSPWGTPLTSEENYEAENTSQWNNKNYENGYPNYADVQNIEKYLGGTFPNPYRYGYIVEITDPTVTATPVKHYTMGRTAHENAVVMPDHKTVYLTDDGSNKAFYKFVATTAGDLSAGTLYAAKVTQDATRAADKAGFDLEWIALGTSNNADIEDLINDFDNIDEDDYVENATSYIPQSRIDAYAANPANGDDELAFIETNRVAAAFGATNEFRKMEGIDINYNGAADGSIPYMYVAMSAVDKTMGDQEGDLQVEGGKCGVVYRLGLDKDFNAQRMEPVVVGGEYDAENTEGYRCPADAIANPDNLIVLDDGRVIIGEDSGTTTHANNMIWVYNPKGE